MFTPAIRCRMSIRCDRGTAGTEHAYRAVADLSQVSANLLHPHGPKQVCRNLNDSEDGFLKDSSHLIFYRDNSITAMRKFIEQNTNTEVVLLPAKNPDLNAYMERWFRSLQSEGIDRMIFFGRK